MRGESTNLLTTPFRFISAAIEAIAVSKSDGTALSLFIAVIAADAVGVTGVAPRAGGAGSRGRRR